MMPLDQISVTKSLGGSVETAEYSPEPESEVIFTDEPYGEADRIPLSFFRVVLNVSLGRKL